MRLLHNDGGLYVLWELEGPQVTGAPSRFIPVSVDCNSCYNHHMAGMANTAPRPCLFTLTQSHTHTHSLSLVLVVMIKSKELKTKISLTHSLIPSDQPHTVAHCQCSICCLKHPHVSSSSYCAASCCAVSTSSPSCCAASSCASCRAASSSPARCCAASSTATCAAYIN